MTKILIIEDKEVGVKASALTPTLYNRYTHNDVFADFAELQQIIKNENKVTGEAREILERLLYVMHKQYDPSAPDFEDFLDQFESPIFVTEFSTDLMLFWIDNIRPSVQSKKK